MVSNDIEEEGNFPGDLGPNSNDFRNISEAVSEAASETASELPMQK